MKMTLENQFTLLQPEWVQLSPLGDFPHSRGLQRVDRSAVETMARNFRSLSSRVGRLFGGLPFYVGHPDSSGASDTADKKAYGWITDLEAREDGLYGKVKWSEPGLELLRNGHYKFFSPFWEAEEIRSAGGQRVYRPVALISVGLTNQPNIPVNPLANEEAACLERTEEPEQLLLPFCAEPKFDKIEVAISNALAEGRITPAEESHWRSTLQNDVQSGTALLNGRSLVLHVSSATEQLRFRPDATVSLANKRARLQQLLRERMAHGVTYDEAWRQFKAERPLLFRQLTT